MSQTIIPHQVMFVTPVNAATGVKCARCGVPVPNPYTTPPLCELHMDLVMLLSHMQQHGIPITLANAKKQLAKARSNGGRWTLTQEDLPAMLNDMLADDPPSPSGRGDGGEGND